MAGPSPHRLYSFAELRAIAGRSWVVCVPCRRYVTLPRGLAERDTRRTTFSCSVCGEEAKHVLILGRHPVGVEIAHRASVPSPPIDV